MGLIRLSGVTATPVLWLWGQRVPLGELTMLDGDGGLGKSTLVIDLAARLSTGAALPHEGRRHQPASTLFVAVEDDPARTIRPRAENHGADLDRLFVLPSFADEEGNEQHLLLPNHIGEIASRLETMENPKVLVFDSMMSNLSPDVNAYNDASIRTALGPLVELARRYELAIIGMRHVGKSAATSTKHKGLGSVGFVNVARSAFVAVPDPDREGSYLLCHTKSNLGPSTPTLRYRLEGCANGQPRVVWEGTSNHTPESLTVAPTPEERGKTAEAKAFLRELLADGAEPSKEVFRQAREVGIKDDTLRRAQAALGIRIAKLPGFHSGWCWAMPDVATTWPGGWEGPALEEDAVR